jgi:hypothetical protein
MIANLFDRAGNSDSSTISVLVETLRQIHEAKMRGTVSDGPPESSSPGPKRNADGEADAPLRYRSLRAGIEQAEARVRRREKGIERELREQASAAPSAAYQETLYLRCQRNNRSGGRFRCENRLGHRTEVRIVKHHFAREGAVLSAEPLLTVEPVCFPLEAGASAVISVTIDLSATIEIPTGALETSLDLIMEETRASKLWIEVDVYEIA